MRRASKNRRFGEMSWVPTVSFRRTSPHSLVGLLTVHPPGRRKNQLVIDENTGVLEVEIVRQGLAMGALVVTIRTRRETSPGEDGDYFIPKWERIYFAPGESTTVVEIPILDDETMETTKAEDRIFFIDIDDSSRYALGKRPTVQVIIMDVDHGDETVEAILESLSFRITMVACTIFALFGPDVVALALPKSFDDYMTGLILACIIMFAIEILLLCLGDRRYLLSLMMFMDVMATFAMVLLLPWIQNSITVDASLARVNRVGKVASRAGKFIKIILLGGKCVALLFSQWQTAQQAGSPWT